MNHQRSGDSGTFHRRRCRRFSSMSLKMQPMCVPMYLYKQHRQLRRGRIIQMTSNDLVIIGFFASITYVVKTLVDARVRWKMAKSEHGSDRYIRTLVYADDHRRRAESIKWGIVLTLLSFGFLAIHAFGWEDINSGVISILLAAVGIGNLLAVFVVKKIGDNWYERSPDVLA